MIARLSEAILLGSTILKPQRAMTISEDGSSGCAIGMALVANGRGRRNTAVGISFLTELYPWVRKTLPSAAPCQCDKALRGVRKWNTSAVIMHLFDEHEWSAEKIADYIATIEPVPAAEQSAPQLTEALVTA